MTHVSAVKRIRIRPYRALLCLALLHLPLTPPTVKADFVIADYLDDFSGTTFPVGWQYLWNPAGVSVSSPTSYQPLAWNGTVWNSDGGATLPRPNPGGSLSLGPMFGHPGIGYDQPGNDGLDHFAVVAYTIGTSADTYYITDSTLRMVDPRHTIGVDTLALIVFTNDFNVLFSQSGFDSTTFDVGLTGVTAGDTVYVAVGPNRRDAFDSFALDFTIRGASNVPEPESLLLLGAGLLGFAALGMARGGKSRLARS